MFFAGAQYEQFGWSLALKGARALVGAPMTGADGLVRVTHLFGRTANGGLVFIKSYRGSGIVELEHFGISVAI